MTAIVFKIGVGKRVKAENIIPKFTITRTGFIKGVLCLCGSRLRINRIFTCRLCFYHGHRRIIAKCIRCLSEREMWHLADDRLVW